MAEQSAGEHRRRNELAVFTTTTEAIRSYVLAGKLDLSGVPQLGEMLEVCHEALLAMEKPGQSTLPGPGRDGH